MVCPLNTLGTPISPHPTTSFLLCNVLHVPLVTKNILSAHKFTLDTNTYIEFHPWYFSVKEQGSGKVLLQGLNENGLYKLPPSVQLHSSGQSSPPSFHSIKSRSSSSNNRSGRVPSLSSSSVSTLVGERTSLENWHSRLGRPTLHLCSRVLAKFNLPVFKSHDFLSCSACLMSKSKQLSFPLSSTHVTQPLELIYTDVWGLSPVYSSSGNRYYVSFLDAFSHYTWLFPMNNKSDACAIFIQFKKKCQTLF
jgi:hypothetical protein